MMLLGLYYQFVWGYYYGFELWCSVFGVCLDWLFFYYYKVDKEGIGFDCSSKGSDVVFQYFDLFCQIYNDKVICFEIYLFWFYYVFWYYQMKSGCMFWGELCYVYDRGVWQVCGFQEVWDSVEFFVDVCWFGEVQLKLKIQMCDVVWWKDVCLFYFQIFLGMFVLVGIECLVYELEDMKCFWLEILNYECFESGFNK